MARKGRPSRSIDDIDATFDEACIARLAKIARLPASADLRSFGVSIRTAVAIYLKDANEPDGNELYHEIAGLYRLADKRRFDDLSAAIENMSDAARAHLDERANRPSFGFSLPKASDFLTASQRDEATRRIIAITVIGGEVVRGGKRPRHRPPALRPRLYAPLPRRHFAKRAAERDFVMWLQVAYLESTGRMPAVTANAERRGPFARLVRECLYLAGARHVNEVEVINSLKTGVRKKRSRNNP